MGYVDKDIFEKYNLLQSICAQRRTKNKMATHSSIFAWRISWTEELAGFSLWGCKESDTT